MSLDLFITLGIILAAVVYVVIRLGRRKGCGCGCSCGSTESSHSTCSHSIQNAPCDCDSSRKNTSNL